MLELEAFPRELLLQAIASAHWIVVRVVVVRSRGSLDNLRRSANSSSNPAHGAILRIVQPAASLRRPRIARWALANPRAYPGPRSHCPWPRDASGCRTF